MIVLCIYNLAEEITETHLLIINKTKLWLSVSE